MRHEIPVIYLFTYLFILGRKFLFIAFVSYRILNRTHCVVSFHSYSLIGPLQLKITWYKIHHAGEQATHWDIQNKDKKLIAA